MSTLFLNLSNHPHDRWSEEQRQAAAGLADGVVDQSFPAVDPAASLAELEEIAARLVGDILARSPAGTVRHAMVQGEFVMTTILVQRLQAEGVRCYAATSERDTLIQDDGSRVSRFRFIQFRPYPHLATP